LEALLLFYGLVIFCINCGARNEADAVFCLSCGQTLYHGPESTTSMPEKGQHRRRFLILASLFTVVGLLVLVFFATKTSDLSKSTPSASKEVAQEVLPITDKAVLTIVGTNHSGTKVKQGSGFILTADGLAGSNYHVIEGISQAVAECCDSHVFEIRSVEGADLDKDLVVFQLYEKGSQYKPHDLPHVVLGASRDSTVGERITTIGSPEGLENTRSDGILSAVREYEGVRLLQITAPISPGSSGGPVFNDAGRVIGIATFQFEKGQNLNFAIAVEHLRPLLDQHLQVSLAQFRSFVRQAQRAEPSAATSRTAETPPQKKKPAAKTLTGQYVGIVHNLSVNLSAEFGILVDETDGGLSGCMGVQQPLFGSGPLFGFVAGSDVSFAVTSPIGTITFVGRRGKESVSGTYTVEHQGAPNEEGTFTLRRYKSEGLGSDFDTSKCPTDAEMNQ
jgi:S1-C subfamily serine protease